MKRRNPPFSPFSEKFDAEILLPLYIGEGKRRFFRRGCNDRKEAALSGLAGLVVLMYWDS